MSGIMSSTGSMSMIHCGPTTATPGHNATAYYRIQGAHLVIEYAPQRLGGDLSNHIHTMYRDPTNDYGRKLTAR